MLPTRCRDGGYAVGIGPWLSQSADRPAWGFSVAPTRLVRQHGGNAPRVYQASVGVEGEGGREGGRGPFASKKVPAPHGELSPPTPSTIAPSFKLGSYLKKV